MGGGGHSALFNPDQVASGSGAGEASRFGREVGGVTKLILEILISAILHPIAVILMWINLAGRTDLNQTQ